MTLPVTFVTHPVKLVRRFLDSLCSLGMTAGRGCAFGPDAQAADTAGGALPLPYGMVPKYSVSKK